MCTGSMDRARRGWPTARRSVLILIATVSCVLLSASPGTAAEQIRNGNFELGKNGDWSAGPKPGGDPSSADIVNLSWPRTGSWYAYLGDLPGHFNAIGSVHQVLVSVPSNATSATLTFWLNVKTNESLSGGIFDRLDVATRRTSDDSLIETLRQYTNQDWTISNNQDGNYGSAPQTINLDVARYRGTNFTFQFYVDTDFSKETIFRIDDVSLITVASSVCGNGAVESGEQCDDGNTANGDCCSSACQYESFGSPCGSDGNQCTSDQCNGSGACTHPNNTASCDDGQFCTVNDACGGGSCVGGPARDCSFLSSACNTGVCNESSDQCVAQAKPIVCNDGNVCGTELCDPPGTSAGCPGGQVCRSDCNACVATGCPDCSGLNDACNTGVCNVSTSTCERQPKSNGTTCSDGNACTVNDRCSSGSCIGDPHCPDGIVESACSEQCDPNASPTGCAAGQTCTSSCTCSGGTGGCTSDMQCADTSACTRDRCVAGSCQHTLGVPPGTEGPAGSVSCSNGVDDDCDGDVDGADSKCFACGSLRIDRLDPLPGLVTESGKLTTDVEALAKTSAIKNNVRVEGIAADGVTELVLRITTREPGTLDLALANPAGSIAFDGFLSDRHYVILDTGVSVSVHTEHTSQGHMAFVIYHAPEMFGDSLQRLRALQAFFTPDVPPVRHGPCYAAVRILRPPIVLVHGFGSEPGTWAEFLSNYVTQSLSPAVNQRPALPITESQPRFFCVADYEEANTSKFAVAAPLLASDVTQCLGDFRKYTAWSGTGSGFSVAATKVDIVAHSMGGLVTRTIPLCQSVSGLFQDCAAGVISALGGPYVRRANYFSGDVRRLVTIDTPHQGTELANAAARLRSAQCDSTYLPGGIVPFEQIARQIFGDDLGGMLTGTATEDLQPGSDALRALNDTPGVIPIHFVHGSATPTDVSEGGEFLRCVNCALLWNDCTEQIPATIGELFNNQANDIVVSTPSQRGGLSPGSPAVSDTVDAIHTSLLTEAGPRCRQQLSRLPRFPKYSDCKTLDAAFQSLGIMSRADLPTSAFALLDGNGSAFQRVP